MTAPEPNQRIGRYALLGRLGRGGMGEVHRARAFGAAGVTKELCIKRIRKGRLAHDGALSRFVDEARLWMRLSHANIVPVFDFGRIGNDYYLAMEWVDGCDLRRLLRDAEQPLDDDVALFIVLEIARALSYLHDGSAHPGRAVAHCDLKPSNVLLSRQAEVKLADFGVAVRVESARAGGTEGYIPPSEERGARVGATSDLYALGRVLEEVFDRSRGEGPEVVAAREIAEALMKAVPSEPMDAAAVVDALEALSAQARVRSKRSARDLLAARVAKIPTELEPIDPTDVSADASFLCDGEDPRSFLSQLETGPADAPSDAPRKNERSSSSRDTPVPAAPRSHLRVAGMVAGGVLLTGLGWQLLSPAGAPTTHGDVHGPVHVEASSGSVATSGLPTPAEDVVVEEAERPAELESVPFPALQDDEPHGERPARAAHPEMPPARESAEVVAAHLRINARPWAEITVDGAPRGVTPITDLMLAPGRHEVLLRHPVTGHESTTVVDLAPGEQRDVVVDLR